MLQRLRDDAEDLAVLDRAAPLQHTNSISYTTRIITCNECLTIYETLPRAFQFFDRN